MDCHTPLTLRSQRRSGRRFDFSSLRGMSEANDEAIHNLAKSKLNYGIFKVIQNYRLPRFHKWNLAMTQERFCFCDSITDFYDCFYLQIATKTCGFLAMTESRVIFDLMPSLREVGTTSWRALRKASHPLQRKSIILYCLKDSIKQ